MCPGLGWQTSCSPELIISVLTKFSCFSSQSTPVDIEGKNIENSPGPDIYLKIYPPTVLFLSIIPPNIRQYFATLSGVWRCQCRTGWTPYMPRSLPRGQVSRLLI